MSYYCIVSFILVIAIIIIKIAIIKIDEFATKSAFLGTYDIFAFSSFFLGYNLNITSYASRLDSTILYLVRPDGQSGLLKDKINHIVITVFTSFIGRTSFISADYSINGEHSGSVTGDGSTRGPQDSFIFFSFQYFSLIPLSLFLLIFIIFAPHILNISTSALFQHT